MTFKRTCLVTTLLVCAAILFNGCGDPDKNKLIFRPELNVARTVNTSDSSSTNMKFMGMDMTIGNSQEVTYIMTPTAVAEDGTVTLEVVYDYVKQEMTGLEGLLSGANMPGMPQIPGMDDPLGTKAMKKALDTLKGEKFTVRVSRFGEVLGVEGADASASKVADALAPPAHLPADQIKQQLRQGLGNEGVMQQMRKVFLTAPDKALKAGDTWERDTALENMDLPMVAKSTITVGERGAGILKLSTVGQYTVDFSKGPMGEMMASGDAKATLSGQGSGTAEFEEATGWPLSWVSTMKASGSVSPMAGMNVPLEISAKTEVSSYPKT